ncbi:MAG: hypothetical protein JW811_06330 [Clostridiales bacterium]|nr:hypothetical protein [Clostridiales bacterium]
MNRRERFLCAIDKRQPDRVPIFATLTPQIAEALGRQMRLPFEAEDSFLSTRISHVEILNRLGNDAVCVGPGRERPTRTLPDGALEDEFGLRYRRAGLYDEAFVRPLAGAQTVEDVDAYVLPDPQADSRYTLAKQRIEAYRGEYAVIADLEATVFELCWNLVGLEKFLMDLYLGEAYVGRLLEKVTAFNLAIAECLAELSCDMIWLGDDLGTQANMLISPEIYRERIKPLHKRIIAAIKSKNPKIKIAYHSCGAVAPVIPDFIGIGVDVLNPIQPLASGMDLGVLKREYGKDLVFFGGIDVQHVLPRGSVQDVEDEVKRRIAQAGEGGGLVLAPAHNIQPDTPLENIFALFEAVQKFGRYV